MGSILIAGNNKTQVPLAELAAIKYLRGPQVIKAEDTMLLIFSGVFVASSGGFILIYLYAVPWFGNFSVFGENIRDLFQMGPLNLSVAVWVGFIVLLGIATDGVVVASYLDQSFRNLHTKTKQEIREATGQADNPNYAVATGSKPRAGLGRSKPGARGRPIPEKGMGILRQPTSLVPRQRYLGGPCLRPGLWARPSPIFGSLFRIPQRVNTRELAMKQAPLRRTVQCRPACWWCGGREGKPSWPSDLGGT